MELIFRLGIALVILICANIALGSFNSWFSEAFDKEKFWKGVKKGLVVIVIFIAVYTSGNLVPEIEATLVGGELVNLTTGMLYVVMAGFLWYAKEVITKLAVLVGGRVEIDELVHDKIKEP
jgi:hypothetical protein